MDIFKILQDELQIGYKQVEAAVRLIDEGNTIPFIARYRKEATGSLIPMTNPAIPAPVKWRSLRESHALRAAADPSMICTGG